MDLRDAIPAVVDAALVGPNMVPMLANVLRHLSSLRRFDGPHAGQDYCLTLGDGGQLVGQYPVDLGLAATGRNRDFGNFDELV